MAVEDPGTLTVTCDECGDTKEMDTTAYCGSPSSFGVDDTTLEENGWDEIDGMILCPKCIEEQEEECDG